MFTFNLWVSKRHMSKAVSQQCVCIQKQTKILAVCETAEFAHAMTDCTRSVEWMCAFSASADQVSVLWRTCCAS